MEKLTWDKNTFVFDISNTSDMTTLAKCANAVGLDYKDKLLENYHGHFGGPQVFERGYGHITFELIDDHIDLQLNGSHDHNLTDKFIMMSSNADQTTFENLTEFTRHVEDQLNIEPGTLDNNLKHVVATFDHELNNGFEQLNNDDLTL